MIVDNQILVANPTGNQIVRHALIALDRAGLLGEFWTSFSWNPHSILNAMMPKSFSSELRRRSFPEVPSDKVRNVPLVEIARLASQYFGTAGMFGSFLHHFSSDYVNKQLDRAVADRLRLHEYFKAVYASEDVALQSFSIAKQKGLKCIYDLPIGHWRVFHEIMKEERERHPEWSQTLFFRPDSPEKLDQKDRELELADTIIVASSFTENTLSAYPHKLTAPVVRFPYGAPPNSGPRRATPRTQPLRILFVGGLGQRKGISYLLDAVDQLECPHTLTLLGRPISVTPPLDRALKRHYWIPTAPHAEVLRIMREHDILVFPSLFEGFGLVLLEAMSQGMVVVTTQNTAGPDILSDGKDGFLVPLRSATAIVEVLTRLSEDRNLLASMSQAAQEKAQAYSWYRYEEQIVLTMQQLLKQRSSASPVENVIFNPLQAKGGFGERARG